MLELEEILCLIDEYGRLYRFKDNIKEEDQGKIIKNLRNDFHESEVVKSIDELTQNNFDKQKLIIIENTGEIVGNSDFLVFFNDKVADDGIKDRWSESRYKDKLSFIKNPSSLIERNIKEKKTNPRPRFQSQSKNLVNIVEFDNTPDVKSNKYKEEFLKKSDKDGHTKKNFKMYLNDFFQKKIILIFLIVAVLSSLIYHINTIEATIIEKFIISIIAVFGGIILSVIGNHLHEIIKEYSKKIKR